MLRKPLFWVLLFTAGWLVLVTVQIAVGMGTAPDGCAPPPREWLCRWLC